MCTATIFSHAGTIGEEVGPEVVLTRSQRHTRPYLKVKHEYYAYDIPLLLSLKQLLSNRFIFEEVSKHGKLYIDAWYKVATLCIKCC